MAFGSIRRSKRKVAAAAVRERSGGRTRKLRRLHVVVDVLRSDADQGRYIAGACFAGEGGRRESLKRCGRTVYGSTPTAAIKNALRTLVKMTK